MKSPIILILVSAWVLTSSAQEPKSTAFQWFDNNAQEIKRINKKIWSYAETGLQETKSSKELIEFIKKNGFTVETAVAGMPTAFVGTYGSGHPIIGILAEYDALPGLSQDTVPFRNERPGVNAGHGCGHSVFGTASVSAAIALKKALEIPRTNGTIKVYGTPAEETGIGKTYMLRDGYFKDCDVILAWHPSDRTASSYNYSKAVVSVKFRFSGLPAHASVSPHEGRSALDAIELMNVGVNYMREHIKEDARIHYVITDGGGQPNVVPPTAEVWYYIRANKHNDVEKYFEWIKEIAQGAAMMTRTKLTSVHIESDLHEVLPNRTLAELINKNLESIGPPTFTNEEKLFAKRTQEMLNNHHDIALSEKIEGLSEFPSQGLASTDIGDISWFVPIGEFIVAAYTYGAPGHSWQIVACTGTSIGEKGMIIAAKTIAATAIDLFQSPELLQRAQEDFKKIRERLEYMTLIPENQAAPKTIR